MWLVCDMKRVVKAILVVVATAAVAAATMVPAPERPATTAAPDELAAAIHQHLSDFPPPAPVSYTGDHYYQWSVVACPSGTYRPPATEPAHGGSPQ